MIITDSYQNCQYQPPGESLQSARVAGAGSDAQFTAEPHSQRKKCRLSTSANPYHLLFLRFLGLSSISGIWFCFLLNSNGERSHGWRRVFAPRASYLVSSSVSSSACSRSFRPGTEALRRGSLILSRRNEVPRFQLLAKSLRWWVLS